MVYYCMYSHSRDAVVYPYVGIDFTVSHLLCRDGVGNSKNNSLKFLCRFFCCTFFFKKKSSVAVVMEIHQHASALLAYVWASVRFLLLCQFFFSNLGKW